MRQLEQSLGKLGSRTLNRILQDYTRTPLHGIGLGVVATAILQSSSVVGLITLAFVGAGILRLKDAIGVILGANLGTTFTGWLVTYLGFKLNLTELYIPLLGLSALGLLISQPQKRIYISFHALFAFALLLMGLFLMKESVEFIHDYVDVNAIAQLNPWVFFLIGVLLTAVTQSSSATMMIALAAVNSEILSLQAAAALVIGADLGTTSTVILGAIQGSVVKRQVAFVHFIFNFIVDVVSFLCLPILLSIITNIYGIEDPLYSLVALHSTFNLLGMMTFIPLVNWLERTAEKLFPSPKQSTLSIEEVSLRVPKAALTAAKKDLHELLISVTLLNSWRLKLNNLLSTHKNSNLEKLTFLKPTVNATYVWLKEKENQMANYLLDLQKQDISEAELNTIQHYQVCVRDALYSAKAIKDAQLDLDEFSETTDFAGQKALSKLLNETETLYSNFISWLDDTTTDLDIQNISDSLNRIKASHDDFNRSIYQLIDDRHLHHEKASSTLNINREILLGSRSLLNAIQHLIFEFKKPSSVTSLINSTHDEFVKNKNGDISNRKSDRL